jgi:hypothetical protein
MDVPEEATTPRRSAIRLTGCGKPLPAIRALVEGEPN